MFFDLLKTKERKLFFTNVFSLSIHQLVNFILPLIILPYLIRVLGVEKFGLVAFAQSFIMYFIIIVDFGFSLSAPREISINKDSIEKVSEIFSSVILIKLFLIVISFIILVCVVLSFDKFRRESALYYMTFLMVIGQALFPIWFFQGMENMKFITYLNIIARTFFVCMIFIFVKDSSDYLYVPFLNGLGFLIVGIISLWLAVRKFKIRIYIPSFERIIFYFKDSFDFFLSRVSVSIYTSSNAFVLGIFTNDYMVGLYSIAEKLYIALQQIYYPLVQTLYPYMSKSRNIAGFFRLFKAAMLINVIMFLVMYKFSYFILYLVAGQSGYASIAIFKILLFSLVVVIISILLGYPLLGALGYKRFVNFTVIFGSLFHLAGLILLVLVGITPYRIATLVVITEMIVLLLRSYGVIKYKIFKVW